MSGIIFVDSLTRLRAQTRTTRGGDTVPDWSVEPDSLVITDVSVQPSSQLEEGTAFSSTRSELWRVLSQPGTNPDVQALDRVIFDGHTFDVDGDVARWPDPHRGGVHHVEFAIRREQGA